MCHLIVSISDLCTLTFFNRYSASVIDFQFTLSDRELVGRVKVVICINAYKIHTDVDFII